MRKNFRMYLTLALVMLGVMSVNAADRIPVDAEHFTFHNYNGWDANAAETGVATGENGNFLLDQANACPIGDTNCNAWIDLGAYSKMYVKMAGCDAAGELNSSNPRIFINRTADNGQFNADKSAAQCLVIPNAGTWAEEYYTVEADGTYVIDLTKIGKEWGFVHFHSIKGSAWDTKAIVNSIEVEKAAASQQIGYINLLENSDLEGDDVSSFAVKEAPSQDIFAPVIVDGIGKDGSRGIKVTALAKTVSDQDYQTQFWVKSPEVITAGSKIRLSFDGRASEDVSVATQSHDAPGEYIHYQLFGNVNFTTDWQHYEKDIEVTEQQAKNASGLEFHSIAFNLSPQETGVIDYFFDNIKFEIYKYGTTAEFSNDVILVDFGFDTNLPDLVKASGKTRLMYPNDCVTVKVNGETQEIYSVEGFADGRFYIFLVNATNAEDEVLVSFTNPTDEALRLIYTSGSIGSVASNFTDVVATLNSDIEDNGGYPFDLEIPVLVKSDPENGSFNLPTGLNTIKLTFDKNVDCTKLKATINGKAMTVTPNTGAASEITLTCDALADGEYAINVTKIYPEEIMADEIFGDTTIVINVGKIVDDPNDQPYDLVPVDYFNNCAENSVPEGFLLVADGEEQRMPGMNYGSGARMMNFAAGGDFTKGLYMRTYYIEYGTLEDHYLDLEADKKYKVTFNSCRWAEAGRYLKFIVIDADGNEVLKKVVENNPNVAEKKDAVSGTTYTEVTFIPETTGRYIMRWIVAKDAEGTETNNDWQNGVILANVKVQYTPNTTGFEYIQLLNTALENAKTTRDGNSAERYAGEALNNLNATIAKYEAEKDGYTAPSAYEIAAAALDAAAQALKDHRVLCDDYDTQIKLALDVERQNKENKFAATEPYAQLQTINAKYHGSSEWVNESEDPEVENWQLHYTYDVLKDDAALTAALAELKSIAELTSLLFTEGKSAVDNANGGKATGVAVLVERIRLGAEALKTLGMAEDHEVIVAANNALTDDDALAETIKNHIKLAIYGKLKEADNDLFAPTVNDETLEEITPEYDMTVFVKNPNIYKQLPYVTDTPFTEESVPGWTTPEGYNRPNLTPGWNNSKNVEGVAEDCMFQTWGSSYRVEQTIADLPAGVYTIQMGFGERNDEESNVDNYIFVKTTDSEEEITTPATVIGQAFPFAGGSGGLSIENVTVTDGILTIGANAGPASHTFFNDVKLLLTAPIAGYDYASDYQGVVDGVEDAKAQTVRALQLYDLNGSRITTARKGIVIVKKIMSDGSVRTEKVIKK